MNIIFRMRLSFRISVIIGIALLALLLTILTELQAFRITADGADPSRIRPPHYIHFLNIAGGIIPW